MEQVDPEKQMKKILEKMKKQPESEELNYPKNYVTLCDFFAIFRGLAAPIGNGF